MRQLNGQMCLQIGNYQKKEHQTEKQLIQERIAYHGMDSLMDEEVLSLLTGINVSEARKALKDFGPKDLIKYKNSLSLTKTQLRKLDLLYLFCKRFSTAPLKEKPVISSSSLAGEYAVSLFEGKPYECFYALCLDSQNRLNKAVLVHEGTINEAPVYPRIIVETALHYRANSLLVAHNHPGGSKNPSYCIV